ncbi:MAG: hypothetical protein ABIG35_11555 [Pseudomonadota bacterium]
MNDILSNYLLTSVIDTYTSGLGKSFKQQRPDGLLVSHEHNPAFGLGYDEILGCRIGKKIAPCDTEAVAQKVIVR